MILDLLTNGGDCRRMDTKGGVFPDDNAVGAVCGLRYVLREVDINFSPPPEM